MEEVKIICAEATKTNRARGIISAEDAFAPDAANYTTTIS